jgi:hypothetical protein
LKEEREWMEDPDPKSDVEIEGYGMMTLEKKLRDRRR